MKNIILTIAAVAVAAFGSTNSFASGTKSASNSHQTRAQKKAKIGAKAKIGMKKAREIALTKASGKIEGAELENEKGKTIYSFDVRNSKGTITEVQVEAYTGEIISVEEENAKTEAAEKKQERQEKHKH